MNLDSAVFYSSDLTKSIPFYRDVLGLNLEYQDGDSYVSFLFPNGARLAIKKKEEQRELPGAQTMILAVESDIKNMYEHLKQQNIVIDEDFVVHDWGQYFSVLDPDGNKVEILER